MKPIQSVLFFLMVLSGCGQREPRQDKDKPGPGGPGLQADQKTSLPEARRGFQTKLARREKDGKPLPVPPPAIFGIVRFAAPLGKLSAYLSPAPADGKKRPAIIWITGGDCNTVGEVWDEPDPKNEQSASAYRKAGIIMMFPSLRGGNDNPGVREGFFGEIDDVLAAADFLARQPFVDPNRIYLGGHSTGGTLVLLTAESSDRFRAVFSFGPADDVRGYDPVFIPFDTTNPREAELRSPGRWLHSIKSPTFVFEGTVGNANHASLQAMARACTNPLGHFYAVKGADHFNILDPVNRLIAAKILRDEGPKTNLAFSEEELNRAFAR
jgi:acetyl esterase/lipase